MLCIVVCVHCVVMIVVFDICVGALCGGSVHLVSFESEFFHLIQRYWKCEPHILNFDLNYFFVGFSKVNETRNFNGCI